MPIVVTNDPVTPNDTVDYSYVSTLHSWKIIRDAHNLDASCVWVKFDYETLEHV